jgi:hypothetical protein
MQVQGYSLKILISAQRGVVRSTVGFWNALVLRERFQSMQNRHTLEICLLNNRANGSTKREISGVSYSITSPCGQSTADISVDPACGTTPCGGRKLLDDARPEASIGATLDVDYSTQP